MLNQKINEGSLNNWFEGLSYLAKIETLLEIYPDLGIAGIESQRVNHLWNKISLEGKQDLYNGAWKRNLK